MFDSFSDRARRALALAREEAHSLRHNFIGTEHLLLGLLREGSGVAAHLLSERSVDPEQIRKNLSCNLSPGESIPAGGGHLPFTPRALSCLQAARREAARLGQEFVGTEHVLLGLLQEPDGVAAHALRDCGLELDDLRRELEELASGALRGAGEAVAGRGPAAAPPGMAGDAEIPTADSVAALFAAAGVPLPDRIQEWQERRRKLEEIDRRIRDLMAEKKQAIDQEQYEHAGRIKEDLRAAHGERESLAEVARQVPPGVKWEELLLAQNRRMIELLERILTALERKGEES